MAVAGAADPYYVARDEVQQVILKVESQHQDWKHILTNESTANNRQFEKLHSDIAGELQQLEYDLQDISATINMVEQNRSKFKLDDSEIQSRKHFVANSRQKLQDIQNHMNSRQVLGKIEGDKRQLLTSQRARGDQDRAARLQQENEAFLGRQRQEQAQMMANQDEQLTELSKTAARLGDTARVINTELQDQQRMLDELGDDIDKETEKLNFVMKRVGRLIKTSDNKQICIIMALFALAVLLVFLIINT